MQTLQISNPRQENQASVSLCMAANFDYIKIDAAAHIYFPNLWPINPL